jgi:hypothetical protein
MNHDALITVACAGLGAALSMALVCKDWRDAIHMAEGAVFDARSVLLKLGDTALISELNEALVLTNRTLSLYPHQTKRRRRRRGLQDLPARDGRLHLPRARWGRETGGATGATFEAETLSEAQVT